MLHRLPMAQWPECKQASGGMGRAEWSCCRESVCLVLHPFSANKLAYGRQTGRKRRSILHVFEICAVRWACESLANERASCEWPSEIDDQRRWTSLTRIHMWGRQETGRRTRVGWWIEGSYRSIHCITPGMLSTIIVPSHRSHG